MAFNLQLDLFGAIEKWIQFRKIDEWVKLAMELFGSFWLGGCFTCGAGLAAHRPPWEALGEGLVAGSIFAVKVWRVSPLTKGMVLALPEKEARQEIKTDTQVIQK